MNKIIDIDLLRRQRALTHWLEDCKRRMSLKFPAIVFESNRWPIKTIYMTEQADQHFATAFAYFKFKDESFSSVIRGLVAELVIQGTLKMINAQIRAFTLLAQTGAQSIFEITLDDLRTVEEACLIRARGHHPSATETCRKLFLLKKQIDLLAAKGVIPWIGFRLRYNVTAELRKIIRDCISKSKAERS